MKKVNWLITDQNITVNYDGQTHIVSRTDALANKLIDALKAKDLDAIPLLVSTAKRVEDFGNGNFVVKDGQIFVNGVLAPKPLGDKIIKFSNEGLPYEPLVKFAENLQKNPSFRAVNELFSFLEKNDHPITENGCFIAYKKVRPDFLDIHTGTIDNSVGNTVEMPRNQVNEDPTQTCSYGLHVANWDYASNFYWSGSDSKMLEVEVNPADVVAVPIDYNQAKMRVCKYVVLGVVDQENSKDTALRITNTRSCVSSLLNKSSEDKEECHYDECDSCGCSCLGSYCKDKFCEECGCGDDFDDDLEEDDDEYPWEDELK
jgi:hypothetical protein